MFCDEGDIPSNQGTCISHHYVSLYMNAVTPTFY